MKKKKDKIDELLREFFKGPGKPDIEEEAVIDFCQVSEMRPMRAGPLPVHEVEREYSPEDRPARKKKPCPTLEILADFIEGVLDKKMELFVQDHLTLCPACAASCKTARDAIERHSQGKSDRTPEDISKETSSQLDELYLESLSPDEDEDDL